MDVHQGNELAEHLGGSAAPAQDFQAFSASSQKAVLEVLKSRRAAYLFMGVSFSVCAVGAFVIFPRFQVFPPVVLGVIVALLVLASAKAGWTLFRTERLLGALRERSPGLNSRPEENRNGA